MELFFRFDATLLREPHFPECTSSNTSAAHLLVVTDADVKHLRRIGGPQAVKVKQNFRLQRRKSNKFTQGFSPKTPMVCKIFHSAFILFEMFLNMVKYLKVKTPLDI